MKNLSKKDIAVMMDSPRGRQALARRMVPAIRMALERKALMFQEKVTIYSMKGVHHSTRAKMRRLCRAAWGKDVGSLEATALYRFIREKGFSEIEQEKT